MIKKYIYFLIIATLISACAPKATRQLRRAEKLIRKAELNGAEWKTDTVYVTKEVITEKQVLDTIVQFTTDTIRISKDRVVTKIKVSPKTIFVHSECLPDTIRIEVPIQVNREIEAPSCYQFIKWWWLLIAFGAGVLGISIWRAVAR